MNRNHPYKDMSSAGVGSRKRATSSRYLDSDSAQVDRNLQSLFVEGASPPRARERPTEGLRKLFEPCSSTFFIVESMAPLDPRCRTDAGRRAGPPRRSTPSDHEVTGEAFPIIPREAATVSARSAEPSGSPKGAPPSPLPADFSSKATLTRGALLGARYELWRILSQDSSQGVVWEALDRRLGRSVAVKVFHAHDVLAMQRGYSKELEALRRVDHPGVVKILDVLLEDGAIVMDLVRGRTLSDPEARRHLRLQDLVSIISQIAEGL